MTTEARLRQDVLLRIRQDYPPSKREVLIFGRPASAATGPGHPDLFGVACGHFLALEIKVAKAKPMPLQVQRIQDLRFAGAYAWVIRSPLDATRAVYQAKIGGRVPAATDPIDFDDWFKEITSQPGAASVADKAEASTEADAAGLEATLDLEATADPNAPTVDLTAGFPPTLEDDPLPEPTPEAVAEMPEVPAEKQRRARRGKYAGPTATELATNNRLTEPAVPAYEHIDGVLRTIGDRITEVWEVAMRLDAKQDMILDRLHKLQVDFDTLLEDES